MNKLSGILFDCDGVLLDSEAIYLDTLVTYLSTIGYSTTIEEVTFVLGKPMKQIAIELRQHFQIPETISNQQLIDGQRLIFRKRFNSMKLIPMDGLIEFLQTCKQKQLRMAIVSSSDLSYLEDVTQRLGIRSYFELLISGEMIEHGKPAPDIYLYAQNKINLPKDELWVIEDSPAGINAATSAEIFTIGYKGSKVIQDTSKADLQVNSYRQLAAMLEQ